ncbi:hypothetical protein [Streptomyces sp. NPDC059092]|uniref:hypothetical protein n=1 Tax=Streptomyces sp. NPDC059092 TaxID=3346725 RepID=UPI00368C56A5
MLSQGAREYFRLSGARALLAAFAPEGVPDDAVRRNAVLAPVLRGFSYAEQGGGRNLYEVADQIRTVADLFGADPAGASPALKNIPHVIPMERTPAVLREVAVHVEEWGSLPWARKFADAAATTGELALRFPRLGRLLPVYFGQDGIAVSDEMSGSSAEEQLAMVIDDVHPACPWHLPGVAGECQEALVLFRNDEETMDRFFSSALNGGSGTLDFVEFFPALAQACLDHLTQSHPPLWEWQGA